MTAIMGLAGCGKSVLLQLLAGYLRPTTGSVYLEGLDLHRQYSQARHLIGYVSQAEIMLPQLTVGASLLYRMGFCRTRVTQGDARELCRDVCVRIGLRDVDDLLEKQVGAPEWRGNYPSGGERRRVNIAHELLSTPKVLLMDEPTSGLSSADADTLVRQMREYSNQMPILMTIHQPGRETFGRFTHLLVIARGGSPVYYGESGKAAAHFRKTNPNLPMAHNENPADYILRSIRYEGSTAAMVRRFQRDALDHEAYPHLVRGGDGAKEGVLGP